MSKPLVPGAGASKHYTIDGREPQSFDRSGKVAARIEGAFSEGELKQAIAKATG